MTDLEAAQQLVTTSMSVRTVLGVLYIAQHKYAKALDAFSVVLQQQSSSPAAANNAALAAYLTVTADFDDSSPATRAASIQEQRRRAAAAGRGNRAKQQQQAHQSQQGTTGAVGSGGAGSPSGGTLGSPKSADASRDSSPNRPMAPRVLAAMASLQLQSQRPKREPNVRVLLDERLHAEEFGAGSQSGRGVGSARSALSMRGVAPPALAGAGGSSGNLAPGTAESTAAQYEDVEMSDDDDGGNGEVRVLVRHCFCCAEHLHPCLASTMSHVVMYRAGSVQVSVASIFVMDPTGGVTVCVCVRPLATISLTSSSYGWSVSVSAPPACLLAAHSRGDVW